MKQSMIIRWLSPCSDTVYGQAIPVHTRLYAMWRFWWQKHKGIQEWTFMLLLMI